MTDAELFDLWLERHPNPSGLPTGDPRKVAQLLPTEVPEHHAPLHATLLAAGLPGITWIPSPNYSPNRDGHNPTWTAGDPNTWLVYHTQVGWMAFTITAFQSPARQASATYLVGLDGSIVQMVRETDAPWTNGTYANNPGSNLDSITIEFEDGGNFNGPRTPALYKTAALLTADIHRRRNIPVIHRGVGGGELRHKECNGAATACPDSLDIDRIIAEANLYLAGGDPYPPVPIPPPTGEDDDMLYVGPLHAFTATLRVFTPANAYRDPATSALVAKAVAAETQVPVVGYRYSTSSVQSPDLGGGVAGPDFVWWRGADGNWYADADLDTSTTAGAPAAAIPASEALNTYFATTLASTPDDDSALATKADLVPLASKTDLSNAINALPKPPTQVTIPAVTVKLS